MDTNLHNSFNKPDLNWVPMSLTFPLEIRSCRALWAPLLRFAQPRLLGTWMHSPQLFICTCSRFLTLVIWRRLNLSQSAEKVRPSMASRPMASCPLFLLEQFFGRYMIGKTFLHHQKLQVNENNFILSNVFLLPMCPPTIDSCANIFICLRNFCGEMICLYSFILLFFSYLYILYKIFLLRAQPFVVHRLSLKNQTYVLFPTRVHSFGQLFLRLL